MLRRRWPNRKLRKYEVQALVTGALALFAISLMAASVLVHWFREAL